MDKLSPRDILYNCVKQLKSRLEETMEKRMLDTFVNIKYVL